MSANIFGERFLGRDVAWHRIGTVLEQPTPSAEEAIRMAGLDFQFTLEPVSFVFNGENIAVPNRAAIVREPTKDHPQPAPLSIVSDKYRIIQNLDIAVLLDELGLPEKWPVETVGALGIGETMFLTLKVGRHDLGGDAGEALEEFFVITDKRDGKSSLRIAYTPVRIVCQNTLTAGMNSATAISSVFHRDGIRSEVKDRVKVMAGMEEARQRTLTLFEHMTKVKITSKRVHTALAKAYPSPSKPAKVEAFEMLSNYNENTTDTDGLMRWSEDSLSSIEFKWSRETARVESLKNEALIRYERFNDTHKAYAETSWALFNAVVENEDFRDGPESLFSSTLWGERARAKVRVLDYLAAVR